MSPRLLKAFGAIIVVAASAGAATQGQAHHAFAAEFDSQKSIKVQGVLSKANIVNPHSWIYLDVRNKDGSVTNWGFEFSTPNTLRANGITRDTVRPGDQITVEGYLAKNGGAFGYAAVVTLGDGRRVRVGGAPDAPQVSSNAR